MESSMTSNDCWDNAASRTDHLPDLGQDLASLDQDSLRSQLAACRASLRAVYRRNQELQRVLDAMPQNIFWKDQDSVYRGCNQAFAEVAGFTCPEEIIGKTDYELCWTPEEAAHFREFDQQVISSSQPQLAVVELPSEINQQQGWVATSKIPLQDESGAVIGVLGLFEDITERAKEEEALRRSEAQLRQQAQQLRQTIGELKQTQTQLVQAEKMSSLGQLVAGIAHELNNPVGFIHGNLCHAHEHIDALLGLVACYQQYYPQPVPELQAHIEQIELDFLQEDLPRMFKSMQVGAERIRQIVLSLRTFSRLDEAEIKPIDLHEGIDSTLMILQNRLKGDRINLPIRVLKDYGNLPLVECYGGPLNQVFMNLLSNAIDAVEEQVLRHLDQEAEQGEQEPEQEASPCICICTRLLENEQVQIAISDNGSGMTPATLDQIFNPFFTTKPPGKGTGLGLSISYQIITERHRGSLTCQSVVGQGSQFMIEIPIYHDSIDPACQALLTTSPSAEPDPTAKGVGRLTR
jgi:two-component system, NtrC family, sensor kinase